MLLCVRKHGDAGIIHRLGRRPSNRKLAGALEQRFWRGLASGMRTSGPTLDAEQWPSWKGHLWGVPREKVCAGLGGTQLEIERQLCGSHWLHFRKRYLRLRHCPEPARAASPSGLRPVGLPAPRMSKPHKKATPNHPWRTFSIWRKSGDFYFALTSHYPPMKRRQAPGWPTRPSEHGEAR